MFCSACGAKNDPGAKFCHGCGAGLSASNVPPPPHDPEIMRGMGGATAVARAPTGKNPVLAAVLSVLIVGVGQFYNGDYKKGAAMLAGAVVLGSVTAGVLWLALAIWSAFDAYQVASGTGKIW